MAGELVPVVMVPRFTTYVGAGVFTTVALDVSAFEKVHLTTWAGPLIGDPGTGADLTAAVLEESQDGDTWSVYGTLLSLPDAHELTTVLLGKRFLRARVELAADASGVVAMTCWSVGYLERRER